MKEHARMEIHNGDEICHQNWALLFRSLTNPIGYEAESFFFLKKPTLKRIASAPTVAEIGEEIRERNLVIREKSL